jgi:hypothetical protein
MSDEAEYLLSIMRQQGRQLVLLAQAVRLLTEQVARQKARIQLLEASEAVSEMQNNGRGIAH